MPEETTPSDEAPGFPAGPSGSGDPSDAGLVPPLKILRKRLNGVYRADGFAGPTRRYVLLVVLLVVLASLPTLAAIVAGTNQLDDGTKGAMDVPFLPPPSSGPVTPIEPAPAPSVDHGGSRGRAGERKIKTRLRYAHQDVPPFEARRGSRGSGRRSTMAGSGQAPSSSSPPSSPDRPSAGGSAPESTTPASSPGVSSADDAGGSPSADDAGDPSDLGSSFDTADSAGDEDDSDSDDADSDDPGDSPSGVDGDRTDWFRHRHCEESAPTAQLPVHHWSPGDWSRSRRRSSMPEREPRGDHW